MMQKENCFSAWSCDVKTGSVTETANNLSIRTQDGKTAGLVDVGTRYALFGDADQSVAVLDLKTGYQSSAIAGSLLMEGQNAPQYLWHKYLLLYSYTGSRYSLS